MHIGIDISRLATQNRTGTEHYTFELLGTLAQLDRLTNYTLYTNGLPPTLPLLGPNFRVSNIPYPRLWTHMRLAWKMKHDIPDVLFIPSHVLPVIHPPRSVVTIHDLGYLAFPEAHTLLRRIDLHLSTMWSARSAQHLIAVSQATKNDLIQHYRVDADKIDVIHHGVASHFQPVADRAIVQATQQRYGIAGDYLLYLGTVQPRKNLLRLIDSFALFVNKQTGATAKRVQLVIAGKRGWLTDAIEARAQEQHIGHLVHFPGYVANEDVPALLTGARAFVFPSLFEGFGMPVLEAMACGTPVLTSTTSSLPEVAGDAALLVSPYNISEIANALERIMTDTILCDTLRSRGFARVKQFTWEQCARKTLNVLLKEEKEQ